MIFTIGLPVAGRPERDDRIDLVHVDDVDQRLIFDPIDRRRIRHPADGFAQPARGGMQRDLEKRRAARHQMKRLAAAAELRIELQSAVDAR